MKKALIISIAWNLLFFCGAALVAYGCWRAYAPLGFVVGGLFLAVLGFGGGFEQIRKAGKRR